MVVSGVAAWLDNNALGVGNALGSNITNIALVLGCAALLAPVTIEHGIIRRELPLLLIISLGMGLLMWDLQLSRLDGVLLLGGFVAFLGWLIYLSQQPQQSASSLVDEVEPPEISLPKAWLYTLASLILLPLSARLLVWGATDLALMLGVSDLVIGLTVVAIGTSLPELAATLASVLKKQHSMAVGGIVGSNIFNSLGVLALPGLLSPGSIPSEALQRDYSVMLLITFLLLAIAFIKPSPVRLSRVEGGILCGGFVGYLLLLYCQST